MGQYGDNPDPKEEIYERFLAEQIYFKQMAERDMEKGSVLRRKSRRVPDYVYANIYKDGNHLSLKPDIDTDSKRKILENRLPGRFGRIGTQPLCDSIGKIDGIWKGVISYAKRRTESNQ